VLTARLGRWARTWMTADPWSSGLGLARTVLALGTLATLLATGPDVLMSPLAGGIRPPLCTGPGAISVWCVTPTGHPEVARWLSVAVLAVVASGWRPMLTVVPHWWVAWSFAASTSVQDGGDQITAILTLLLIPIGLTDLRRSHWQRSERPAGVTVARVVAYAALLLIHLQVAGLYFQASVSKLSVAEWGDGTATFYWFQHTVFGAPAYLHPVTSIVGGSPLLVSLTTYASLVVEFALGIAIFFSQRTKSILLVLGLLFHDMIALTMGLISFDAAMSAALLLYLLPIGYQVRKPGWFARLERWPVAARPPVAQEARLE
jgi:antimicrobial peptide system SdpB family protein